MSLKAGTAVVDISPQLPVALFGYPHVERIAEAIHDPLLAPVLFLQTPDAAGVLIALDLLMLGPEHARDLRRAVARAVGVPEACVLISCTHTHSGPVTARLLAWDADPTIPRPDPRYLARVKDETVAAAVRAASQARPAVLAWTTADGLGVGGNRHHRDGITDPEVGVLAVADAVDRRLLATAVIYGMHPTVLHEDSRCVSSDFPHDLRQHLRELWGPDLVVLYHLAPSGNQSPRYFVQGQTFAEAERLGRKLAEAVAASLQRLPRDRFRDQVRIAGRIEPVDLPRRELLPLDEANALLARCRAGWERLQAVGAPTAAVRTAECTVFGAEAAVTLARLEQQGIVAKTLESYLPIEVQALRIGDACLAGLPGELFAEYALQIKRGDAREAEFVPRAEGMRTFVVSLVGGDLQGYVTVAQAAASGGYETFTAVFDGPRSGRILVDTARRLLASLSDL